MRPRGSIRLFSVGGVPVYAHFTLPIVFVLVGRLSFAPGAWLGVLLVILAHELGHAALIRRFRRPVLWIALYGFGGECATVDWLTPWERALIAWGGVMGQAVLLAVVVAVTQLGLWPAVVLHSEFLFAAAAANVLIALFNLLPFGRLDGAQAWRVLRLGYLEGKRRWVARRIAANRRRHLH